MNTAIVAVNSTLNVADAVALADAIPISNHRGVKTTPPPNPTNPPKNPANRLDCTVLSNTELILPSTN